MYLPTLLLCSSALVHAAPRFTPRASVTTDTGLSRLTSNDQVQAIMAAAPNHCWNGAIPWPQNDCPLPVADGQGGTQLSLYAIPATSPNTLTVHNYCDYDIHYQHLSGPATLGAGVLRARDTFRAPLAGTNWKASKTADNASPLQVEYSIDATGVLWYNLSLIDCLVKKNGMNTRDTGLCAGHELGLQLGNREVISWQCGPGMWCDDQAYFYHENLCKKNNPVRQCRPEVGITMEFCAANKK